jgi:oligoendopeptidase F
MTALPNRAGLAAEGKWNIEALFASQEAWSQALAVAQGFPEQIATFKGRLGAAPVLYQALQLRGDLMLELYKLDMYASMQQSTDGNNAMYSSMVAQVRSLDAQFGAAAAYIEPEILATPHLESLLQNPELSVYRHHLEVLQAKKPYVQTPDIEALLAAVSDPLAGHSATASAATNADMRFAAAEGHEVSHSSAGELLVHPNRAVRKAAWESYADGHLVFRNTLASTLQGSVKAYAFTAKTRGYTSSLEMSLAHNHIPRAVFDNLLTIFKKHLPTWHRFWRLRKKHFGSLHTYDVPIYDSPAPLTPSPKISFAEGAQMVCRGMEPLGQEYVTAMRKGLFEDCWVDWGQNQGKRAGAYSHGIKGSFPYIFMSWSDDLFSMSTLAHELGHSMHSYYCKRKQPTVYARYSLFIAEVASNFNQALTRARLLKEATTPEQKLAILDEAFSNFHRYLFVMPTLARFELELYERIEHGEALPAPWLIERCAELFEEGYGGELSIDHERMGASWMMFGHLYSPFYVYQYATGIAAANALAKDVLEQGEPAAKRYLDFLSVGDAVYPLEALEIAGIDMHDPQAIERGFGVLASMVDELEDLI